MSTQAARLSLFDCIAIGINGIVGSGIFLLPGWVAAGALVLSPLAFLACGALCTLIALCFAEVAGMFEKSGGPYLYAREAFGDFVGFSVGWMSAASAVLGFATVAKTLGGEYSRGLRLDESLGTPIFAVLVIAVLGGLNLRAIKTGARASTILSFAKIAPLLAFVVLGLFHFDKDTLLDLGTPTLPGFGEGMVSAVYALSGFEFVSVVAGESENPRRNVPIAIVGSLVGAVVLYALIQLVCASTLPTLLTSRAPLVDAATAFGGTGFGTVIRIGAIISMTGFCSGSALVVPRYFSALASDGILPRPLAKVHPTHGTPHMAIFFVIFTTIALVLFFDVKALADLTVISLFFQYVPTCLALIVFRVKRPDAPRWFRIPFGPVIPVVCTALVIFLVTRLGKPELTTGGAILAIGMVVYAVTRALKARSGPAPGAGT